MPEVVASHVKTLHWVHSVLKALVAPTRHDSEHEKGSKDASVHEKAPVVNCLKNPMYWAFLVFDSTMLILHF